MAPSAESPSGQAPDQVDGVAKPPPNVALPPPEMRKNIETVADYVNRNGAAFEERIFSLNADNPKFFFLKPNDPYNSFYKWRLEEAEAGRSASQKAGGKAAGSTPVPQKPKGPEPPPDFEFSVRMPIINAQDLDVVRLTALFVAKNGRSFTTALSQKEAANYQFDFLRTQHSLYQYFTRLVDQYTLLLKDSDQDEKERVDQLTASLDDKFIPLRRAKQRSEWLKHQEKQKVQKDEAAEQEKIAYAQIDWHDFVVLENVMFVEEDTEIDLPAPTTLHEIQTKSLEQKAATSIAPSSRRIEETMPGEEVWNGPRPMSQPQAPGANYPPPPVPQLPARPSMSPAINEGTFAPPQLPPQPMAAADADRTASPAQAGSRAPANRPMNIRSNYVPRAQANRQAQTVQCPNCKDYFPVDEIDRHMRIEMLSPQWKEQRAKAEARHSTTNLSTSDVANNLKRLASQRTDVFDGVTGEQISEEEASRRKRAAQSSYDGVLMGEGPQRDPNSIQAQARMQQMQDMTINEQIRQIHRKAQGDPNQQQ